MESGFTKNNLNNDGYTFKNNRKENIDDLRLTTYRKAFNRKNYRYPYNFN